MCWSRKWYGSRKISLIWIFALFVIILFILQSLSGATNPPQGRRGSNVDAGWGELKWHLLNERNHSYITRVRAPATPPPFHSSGSRIWVTAARLFVPRLTVVPASEGTTTNSRPFCRLERTPSTCDTLLRENKIFHSLHAHCNWDIFRDALEKNATGKTLKLVLENPDLTSWWRNWSFFPFFFNQKYLISRQEQRNSATEITQYIHNYFQFERSM